MKPLKAFLPLSRWMLRITLMIWLIIQHASRVQSLDYNNIGFFIALAFLLFGVLLFAGGFSNKPTLTVISGIFLSLLFLYQIYVGFIPQVTQPQILSVLFLSVSIYFMSSANK